VFLLAAVSGSPSGREANTAGERRVRGTDPENVRSAKLTGRIGTGKFLQVAPQPVSQGPGWVCV